MAKKKGHSSSSGSCGQGGTPDTWKAAGGGIVVVVALFLANRLRGGDGRTPPPTEPGPANDLIRLGFQNPHVDLRVFSKEFPDTGRGLAAARHFAAGETVMQVPFLESAYIGKHNLPLTFSFHESKDGLLDGGQGAKQRLALAVLLEKQKIYDKDGTKWAPFFAALPKTINNLAQFTEAQRRAVKDSDVGKKFEQFDELFNATVRFVKNARVLFTPVPTEKEIRWAVAMVESRAHMHSDGEERILWPYLILGNHHYNKDKTLKYITEPGLPGQPTLIKLTAQAPIRKGEEVFFHYGSHGNIRLLIQYGFTIPSNPILEPCPIRIISKAGMNLFRHGRQLEPRGPPCKDIAEKALETMKRTVNDYAGLPDTLIRCWRQIQFETLEDARAAVDAGMLDSGLKDDYFSAVPHKWLENDANTLDEIVASCASERAPLLDEPGGALHELRGLTDAVSTQLHASIMKEIAAWNRCVDNVGGQAAKIRKFLSQSPE